MALIILFGPTGAGKTYAGQLLAKEFNYFFYDGDTDLTDEMKQALNSMKVITDRMRSKFINQLIYSTARLAKQHSNLVVAQTFIKDKYRRRLLKRLPQAKFVLVQAPPPLRHRRRQLRADYPWDETYVKKMDALFENPTGPFHTLTNQADGPDKLKSSLQQLLSSLS